MKKTLIIIVAILAGLYIILSVLDKSEYALEKQIYRTQQEYTRIMADPKVIPAKEFENLITRYQRLIAKYPKSQMTPNLFLFIGALYNVQDLQEKAIDNFGEILKRYPDQRLLCATALLNIANIHANADDVLRVDRCFGQHLSRCVNDRLPP